MIVVPPPAAPPPDREYPKIELKAEVYEFARMVMVPSNERPPATVPWEDIQNLMREIGFTFKKRRSRGGLNVFQPTDYLRESQVSHIPRFSSVVKLKLFPDVIALGAK